MNRQRFKGGVALTSLALLILLGSGGAPRGAAAGPAADAVGALVSDPALSWHTFLGSAVNGDSGYAVAVDEVGNIYVAGLSVAAWGEPVQPHAGGIDAFVAKLDSRGVRQWHTFLGGLGDDYGQAVAVDGAGNIYVAGYSTAAWGAPVRPYAGGRDAFVAKLDGSGVRQWHTFLGGTGYDYGFALAVSTDGPVVGRIYVAGVSPTTWGAPVAPHTGGDDAFAARLTGNGELVWNTFMGGVGTEYGNAIATDQAGNVYVAGTGPAWGVPVNPHAGYTDAFVAKLDDGGARQWHTFLGSSYADDGAAIAVDGTGNAYVAGDSYATWGAPVNPYAGWFDAFVARLDSNGARQWHTFLGSAGFDDSRAIAVSTGEAGAERIYVTGESHATWGAPANPHTAGWQHDAFVAQLNDSGSLMRNTFLGSTEDDFSRGIAVSVDVTGTEHVYVAGESLAAWGAPVNPYAGWLDAFVARLDPVKFRMHLPLAMHESPYQANSPTP